MSRNGRSNSPRRPPPDFIGAVKALADFRSGLRNFLSSSESILETVGITSQQYQALLVLILAGSSGVTVGELARQLLLVPHGAVQLVNRLSDKGYAERRSDPQDARISRVRATPKAVQVMKSLVKAHARELRSQEKLLHKSLNSLKRVTELET